MFIDSAILHHGYTIWEQRFGRRCRMEPTTSAACGSQMARIRRPGLNYCQRKRTVRLKPKKPKAPEDETPIGDHPPGDGPTDGNPGYPPRVLEDATVCLRLESKYTGSLGNLTQFTLAPGS